MANSRYIEQLLNEWAEARIRRIPGLSYNKQSPEYRIWKFGLSVDRSRQNHGAQYHPRPLKFRKPAIRAQLVILTLPDDYRRILELRYIFGKRPADIAKQTTRSEKEWETFLIEAIEAFKKGWKEERAANVARAEA